MKLVQVSATGDVATGAPAYYLYSVTLTAGSTDATLEIRDGSGGPVKMTLKAPLSVTGTSTTWTAGSRVMFGSTIHATFAGTSTAAVASFEFC